jgi:hypothetical protein
MEYRRITHFDELVNCHKTFNITNYTPIKKIIIYTRPLDLTSEMIVSLHELAKKINDMKYRNVIAKLFIFNGLRYENEYCEDFCELNELTDDSIAIYPEIISGNPLNSKNVARWIIMGLGKDAPENQYTNWGNDDLIYHFKLDEKFNTSDKIDSLYKTLNNCDENIHSFIDDINNIPFMSNKVSNIFK